jgi:hypothetical protein
LIFLYFERTRFFRFRYLVVDANVFSQVPFEFGPAFFRTCNIDCEDRVLVTRVFRFNLTIDRYD